MRDILFKAKHKDSERWIEGFYCAMQETTYCFAEDYDKIPVPVHHLIARDEMTDWGLPNKLRLYEVDPGTLCQYTGKTDANGVKIWENDIVVFSDTYSTESGYAEGSCEGKVVWDEETMAFQVTNRLSAESYEALNECAVIGNVFDKREVTEETS